MAIQSKKSIETHQVKGSIRGLGSSIKDFRNLLSGPNWQTSKVLKLSVKLKVFTFYDSLKAPSRGHPTSGNERSNSKEKRFDFGMLRRNKPLKPETKFGLQVVKVFD